jgi:hypothetical protein
MPFRSEAKKNAAALARRSENGLSLLQGNFSGTVFASKVQFCTFLTKLGHLGALRGRKPAACIVASSHWHGATPISKTAHSTITVAEDIGPHARYERKVCGAFSRIGQLNHVCRGRRVHFRHSPTQRKML